MVLNATMLYFYIIVCELFKNIVLFIIDKIFELNDEYILLVDKTIHNNISIIYRIILLYFIKKLVNGIWANSNKLV